MGTPVQQQVVMRMPPPDKAQVACPWPDCKQVSEQVAPRIELVNQPTFSVVMLAHESPWLCPKCERPFTAIIGGIDKQFHMTLLWVPVEIMVPKPQIIMPDKRIITPQ